LVLPRDPDLDEGLEPHPVRALLDEAVEVGEAQDRRQGAARHSPVGALALPIRDAERLQPLDRRRRHRGIELHQRRSIDRAGRPDPGLCGGRVGHEARQRLIGRAVQDPLLAVAREPVLHEQLDVVVLVRAGDVEPGGATLLTLAEHLLDQPIPDLAGATGAARAVRRCSDGVELHDRPVVAPVLALHPDEARDVAVLLVDEQQVVWAERDERQPEQAEHADRRTIHGQSERA
jgi:hypothetical protein